MAAGTCIVCGARSSRPLYSGLLRCGECDFVSADVSPTDADLRALYGDGYFRGGEYADYPADKRCIQRNFMARLRTLKRFAGRERHRRLLEIGCAYGYFLELAQREFERVQGIDLTGPGTTFARDQLGLDALSGDFLEHDFDADRFDVVCMWDTIEHLRDPHLYLQKVAAHTSPGALLALTTGDIDSVNARVRRGGWRLIHPPTHLHYFSRATLGRLLDRHGFDIVYSGHCGFWRSARTTAYGVLVLRYGQARLFERLRRAGVLDFNVYLNLFDIMSVIARRR